MLTLAKYLTSSYICIYICDHCDFGFWISPQRHHCDLYVQFQILKDIFLNTHKF